MLEQQPRYDSYKDSGIDWIGEVSTEWDVQPLRSIFEFRNEKNDPVQTENILSLSIAHGVTPYSEEGRGGNKRKDDLTAYKLAHPRDIVLNSMNVIVGAVGLSNYFGAISPVYYALKPKPHRANVNFYSYVFQNQSFLSGLLRYGKGIMMKLSGTGKLNTIRMKISTSDLKQVRFPVPDLDTQNRIVKFLDEKTAEIDAAIEKKRRLIDLLNEQKAILINRAVTKGLNPDAPMKDSGVDWIGEIPAHWDVKRVKHVAQVSPSKTGDNVKRNDTLAVFLPMEAISRLGEIDQTNVRPTREVFDGLTYFQRGDVVVAKITPCFENGKGAWLDGLETTYGFGTTELHVLRPKQVHGGFLHLLLSRKDFLLHGEEFMEGSAGQKRVPTDFIADYLFGMPPMEEQVAIKAHCDATSKDYSTAVNHQNTGINTLNEFKQTLIANAVTGKIKI